MGAVEDVLLLLAYLLWLMSLLCCGFRLTVAGISAIAGIHVVTDIFAFDGIPSVFLSFILQPQRLKHGIHHGFFYNFFFPTPKKAEKTHEILYQRRHYN